MTKIEDPVKRKPRLVLWPRGAFLFNTRLPSSVADSQVLQKSPQIALRMICHHFHHQRTRTITYRDWLHVAINRIRIPEEFAFTIFIAAQHAAPLEGFTKLSTHEDVDPESKTDLLGLALVIALLGRQYGTNSPDVAKYIKDHIDAFCFIFLLCHYDVAVKLIRSPTFTPPSLPIEVPLQALTNFDLFLEGTYVTSKDVATSEIIPRSFSALMSVLLSADQQYVPEKQLVNVLWKSLQTDMFSLDRSSKASRDSRSVTRTITSTQLAEHRKLSLRAWTHMEILTNAVYRGAHLRIGEGVRGLSSLVFHLPHCRSVEIADCDAVGPIVLGPISGLLRIYNVRNTIVSAICPRVIVEDCEDVTLYINTSTAPVIAGICKGIALAPYNVFCDALPYELRRSRTELLGHQANCWNRPIVLPPSTVGDICESCQKDAPYKPLEPDQFTMQPTPFTQSTKTDAYRTFEDSIPPEYLESWKRRRRIADARLTAMKPFEREDVSPIAAADREYLLKRVSGK